VKVYLDEDLPPAIAALLRRRGMDATSAHEVGNSQLADRAQLDHAPRESRAIVTRNIVDFLALARDVVASNTRHAGIILLSSGFRADEHRAIADAIVQELKSYPKGPGGVVLYVKR
jgi:predicted nuclease of predicted toxin-antitoxin system